MELRGTGLKAKPLRRQATALKHARQATAAGVGAPRDVKTNDNVAVAPALSRRGIKGVVKKNGLSKLEPMPVNGHSNAKLDDKRRLPIVEEAQLLLGVPSDDALGHTGQVRVKFNHYNKLFAVHNGVLRWCLIDDEYCLSFVYKGNFRRDLHIIPLPEIQPESKINKQQSFVSKLDWPRAIRDEMGIYFLSIDTTREYELLVEEDAEAGVGAEGLRLREGPLRAHELTATLRNNSSNVSVGRGCGDACSPLKTANNAVRDLTEQLKAMDASALGSVVARELVEQRDIEDILFSS